VTVLITGAAGNLGSRLARRLLGNVDLLPTLRYPTFEQGKQTLL
jgi:nucleoside-diphosphate-sugar epimerase